MLSRKSTQEKGYYMSTFVFKKIVDQSLLNAGLSIPSESHNKLLYALGITLPKGAKQNIKIKRRKKSNMSGTERSLYI